MKLAAAWALILQALLGPAQAQTSPVAAPVPLARLSLGEIGGWITLELSLGHQRGRWLIDTGASRNLVSSALVRRLGLSARDPVVAETLLGAVQGGAVDLPTIAVGGVERSGQTALAIDLAALVGDAAEGLDGVLGVPFLEGVQLDLDLRDWSAQFRPADGSPCPDGSSALALRRHRRLPVITVLVGEPPVAEDHVLDTGNPAALLRVVAQAADADTPGLAVPGGHRLALMPRVALGPQTRTDVPVLRVVAPALAKGFDGRLRGLAGTAFIDGARWRLDLAHNQLCVQALQVATPGGFGFALARQGGVLSLSTVLPGSPAALAGLREGDGVTRWPGGDTARPLALLWAQVQGREEIVIGVGEPVREVTLRRALFAPLAGP